MEEYKALSVLIGKKITVHPLHDAPYECTAIDILENGILSVKKENGDVIQLQSGEVSLRF